MNARKFFWQPGDLQPAWMALAPREQQLQLAQLMAANPGQQEQARRMLAASPWSETSEDASARVAQVCEFLMEEPS